MGSVDKTRNYKTIFFRDRLSNRLENWAKRLNAFLQFNQKDILKNAGKVTRAIAKSFSESEFEKYRIIQDSLFESDFDKDVKRFGTKKTNNE